MLILASASPRRSELLRNAGFSFTVAPANADETPLPGEAPERMVARLACLKAEACDATLPLPAETTHILGADTTVVLDSAILNKPRDAEEAARMLRLLSGRSHQVLTGVCLLTLTPDGARRVQQDISRTTVSFTAIPEAAIQAYIATGEPLDKAGAYAIQGGASRWTRRIEGCYFNVVGLPVQMVAAMLESAEAKRAEARSS